MLGCWARRQSQRQCPLPPILRSAPHPHTHTRLHAEILHRLQLAVPVHALQGLNLRLDKHTRRGSCRGVAGELCVPAAAAAAAAAAAPAAAGMPGPGAAALTWKSSPIFSQRFTIVARACGMDTAGRGRVATRTSSGGAPDRDLPTARARACAHIFGGHAEEGRELEESLHEAHLQRWRDCKGKEARAGRAAAPAAAGPATEGTCHCTAAPAALLLTSS